jgi:hypothetical protein
MERLLFSDRMTNTIDEAGTLMSKVICMTQTPRVQTPSLSYLPTGGFDGFLIKQTLDLFAL